MFGLLIGRTDPSFGMPADRPAVGATGASACSSSGDENLSLYRVTPTDGPVPLVRVRLQDALGGSPVGCSMPVTLCLLNQLGQPPGCMRCEGLPCRNDGTSFGVGTQAGRAA